MSPTNGMHRERSGPLAYMASNGIAANLLMCGIIAAGLVSWTGLEREAWPTVPFYHIEVSMVYPGATPEEAEESIVVKIEDELTTLASVSRVGVSGVRQYEISIEVPLQR
ncbi:efflux RND transporter permease subunit [Candidatus Palauibacter sp.]|uniref:efflux RND transporter permease subunit n=1 Tax=Candidatus Palauibacter sp. TaxID=3101350 RepID=UPI003AF204DC